MPSAVARETPGVLQVAGLDAVDRDQQRAGYLLLEQGGIARVVAHGRLAAAREREHGQCEENGETEETGTNHLHLRANFQELPGGNTGRIAMQGYPDCATGPCDDFTSIRGKILLQTAQNVASLLNMLR